MIIKLLVKKENLFDDITMNQSKRLSKLTGDIAKEILMLITKDDVF